VGMSDLEDDGEASRTQLCNKRNGTLFLNIIYGTLLVTDKPKYSHVNDSRYMRFCYPRFHISAALFQCHEEYQCAVCGHDKTCLAYPVS
jgi:hypothetical protein